MVHVQKMNHKGDEQNEMSCEQVIQLFDKIKENHFLVNAETNTVIHDPSQIRETDTITIMPVVAGG